jgi:hypothetical protein
MSDDEGFTHTHKKVENGDEEDEIQDMDAAPSNFIPSKVGKKVLRLSAGGPVDKSSTEEAVEQNRLSMVDHASKKGKKRSRDDDDEERKTKKSKSERRAIVEFEPDEVDFTAVEAQLKAEIAAALKAKDKREKARVVETKLEKKGKKRKRISTGDLEKEVKKAKKEKKEKKEKRRKAEEE